MIEPTSTMLAAERATTRQLKNISHAYERVKEAERDEETDPAVQSDKDFDVAVLNDLDHAHGAILGVLFVTTHIEHFNANLPRHGGVLDAMLNRKSFEAGHAMTCVISFTSELMCKDDL